MCSGEHIGRCVGVWRFRLSKQTTTRLTYLLGGSCLVITGVISPLIWAITIATILITPLITTHEPPSIQFPIVINLFPDNDRFLRVQVTPKALHALLSGQGRRAQVTTTWETEEVARLRCRGLGCFRVQGLGFRGLGVGVNRGIMVYTTSHGSRQVVRKREARIEGLPVLPET